MSQGRTHLDYSAIIGEIHPCLPETPKYLYQNLLLLSEAFLCTIFLFIQYLATGRFLLILMKAMAVLGNVWETFTQQLASDCIAKSMLQKKHYFCWEIHLWKVWLFAPIFITFHYFIDEMLRNRWFSSYEGHHSRLVVLTSFSNFSFVSKQSQFTVNVVTEYFGQIIYSVFRILDSIPSDSGMYASSVVFNQLLNQYPLLIYIPNKQSFKVVLYHSCVWVM